MMKMNKKREYTHEDMEALGREIEVQRVRARQVDQDIRCGAISHEQWVSAAYELMERKKEILEILVDVDRYKQDLRVEIEKEKKLREAAEEKISILAFTYSLYESCKMNYIDYGEYVEDILTRMMNGDDDYRSMIPCYYTPGKKQEKKAAIKQEQSELAHFAERKQSRPKVKVA